MNLRKLKRHKQFKVGSYNQCRKMTKENKNKPFKKVISIMAGRSELYD